MLNLCALFTSPKKVTKKSGYCQKSEVGAFFRSAGRDPHVELQFLLALPAVVFLLLNGMQAPCEQHSPATSAILLTTSEQWFRRPIRDLARWYFYVFVSLYSRRQEIAYKTSRTVYINAMKYLATETPTI